MLGGGEVAFKGGGSVVGILEVWGWVGKGPNLMFVDGANSKLCETSKMTESVNVPFPYLENRSTCAHIQIKPNVEQSRLSS